MEVGGQVEALLLKGFDSVTCFVPVNDFGQDVATIKIRLSKPTVVTSAIVSWELPC